MAGPVIKIRSPFASRRGTGDIVAVELDDNFLKIAHLQAKALKKEISHVVVHPVQNMLEDGIVLLIKQSIDKFKINDPRVLLMVPLPLVITRNIEIPSQDPNEIKEIVNLQASRHTPYARAEIIVDMLNLGVVRERYSKVLLVIVPKETVNRQIQILDRAGLKLQKVAFPPEALATHFGRILDKDIKDEVVAIIHVDEAFTGFTIIKDGKALFVRGIHIGSTQLAEDREAYLDRFQDELEKSLESYATDEIGTPPKAGILTGVFSQIPDMDEIISEALEIPIRKQSYSEAFAFSEEAKLAIHSSTHASFLNLLSTASLAEKLKVDLTSEEKRLKIALERRAKEMFKIGIVTMIIFSLLFVNVMTKISFKRAYLKQITTHYLPVRDSARQLEQMLAKTELVKAYLVSRGASLETLTELYDATPLDVRLTEIKYDESAGKFSIKGTSAVMSSVFTYVSELDKSSIFKNVKTKGVNSRNEGGRDVADFEINAMIETKVRPTP